eukprot:TRINITY_DN13764_c0_g1_i2.p1 TRINITY_DN13764_c0_g1~~TRINITY_DN13764_c0_g1_i2.p1  ORF type:complete len:105 (-),score=34.37 TRINITY_DN13764_c0_g1_i2:92-406(-)
MCIRDSTKEEELMVGFCTFQLRTSRNVACAWYEHWFHGGLEYQIEHHLFPQLPRHSLSKAQPLVKEFCTEHELVYREDGFVEAITGIMTNFRRLALDVFNLEFI